MLLEAERALIVRHAGLLGPDGLVVGTAGNLSVRTGDLVAITPSSVAYDELVPGAICVVGLDGEIVAAERAPSSELPMHLAVYRATAAAAIVHTHAPYATALATVADELPAIHYLIAELGGPVRVAPYATFGTEELAGSVTDALAGRSAVLLGSHGTLTIGSTLEQAYRRSVLLEWLAALYYRAALLGEPPLSEATSSSAWPTGCSRCRRKHEPDPRRDVPRLPGIYEVWAATQCPPPAARHSSAAPAARTTRASGPSAPSQHATPTETVTSSTSERMRSARSSAGPSGQPGKAAAKAPSS